MKEADLRSSAAAAAHQPPAWSLTETNCGVLWLLVSVTPHTLLQGLHVKPPPPPALYDHRLSPTHLYCTHVALFPWSSASGSHQTLWGAGPVPWKSSHQILLTSKFLPMISSQFNQMWAQGLQVRLFSTWLTFKPSGVWNLLFPLQTYCTGIATFN